MRLLLLIALMLPSLSFGSEYIQKRLAFSFLGDEQGNKIYMQCTTAKKMAEAHLIALGALNIKLNCAGGLESWDPSRILTPMYITGRFEAIDNSEREKTETVVLDASRGIHKDCYFNTQFLKRAVELFPTAKVKSKKDSCLSNNTRWSYILEVAL